MPFVKIGLESFKKVFIALRNVLRNNQTFDGANNNGLLFFYMIFNKDNFCPNKLYQILGVPKAVFVENDNNLFLLFCDNNDKISISVK